MGVGPGQGYYRRPNCSWRLCRGTIALLTVVTLVIFAEDPDSSHMLWLGPSLCSASKRVTCNDAILDIRFQVFVGKYEGTIVAIKLLLGVDSMALQRFQREVAMLAGEWSSCTRGAPRPELKPPRPPSACYSSTWQGRCRFNQALVYPCLPNPSILYVLVSGLVTLSSYVILCRSCVFCLCAPLCC
jgi:hypothetical protein